MKTLITFVRRQTARLVALGLLATPFTPMVEANAAIISRAPGLVYDSTLNVTWATDANLFETLAARMGGRLPLAQAIYRDHSRVPTLPSLHTSGLVRTPQGLQPVYDLVQEVTLQNGTVLPYPDFTLTVSPALRVNFNWFAAKAFVDYVNGIGYLGYNDWRLPRMLDGACVIFVNTAVNQCPGGPWNEVQSLYGSLGQQEDIPLFSSGGHNAAYELFSRGFATKHYWLGDEIERVDGVLDESKQLIGFVIDAGNFSSALLALEAFGLPSADGDTFAKDKRNFFAGLVILRDGDTAPGTDATGGNPMSVPAPLGLMGIGVLALVAVRQRRIVRHRS